MFGKYSDLDLLILSIRLIADSFCNETRSLVRSVMLQMLEIHKDLSILSEVEAATSVIKHHVSIQYVV